MVGWERLHFFFKILLERASETASEREDEQGRQRGKQARR